MSVSAANFAELKKNVSYISLMFQVQILVVTFHVRRNGLSSFLEGAISPSTPGLLPYSVFEFVNSGVLVSALSRAISLEETWFKFVCLLPSYLSADGLALWVIEAYKLPRRDKATWL